MMTLYIHSNLRYKFGNRHFGEDGYYMGKLRLNEKTIAKYIRQQEKYDQIMDKIITKELENHFKDIYLSNRLTID